MASPEAQNIEINMEKSYKYGLPDAEKGKLTITEEG